MKMEVSIQRKRILMIAPEPFFEPRGTPFSVLGRLKALSQLGHEVDLLTYPVGQDVVIPGVRIIRTSPIRFIRQVPIGPSWTKLFLDVFLFVKAVRLLLQARYDLLHTHEEASLFGTMLAKLFGTRHLYDMHSSLPQQLENFQFTRFRPLIGLFAWLERRVIRSSDAVISICPALDEHLKRVNGHGRHVMIENVASVLDSQAVTEEDLGRFMTAHSFLVKKKIVLYAGTFERYQGIDLLIASAEQVLRRHGDVLFLLVGGTPDQVRHYEDRVKQVGLSAHFHFTGTRPPEQIPVFVRLSQVLVSPRTTGTNTPLKIYSYLESAKPIVATRLPTHTQVLSSEVAVLVEPNPDAFAQGILVVLEDPLLAGKLGREARKLFENQYSFQRFVENTDRALQLALS